MYCQKCRVPLRLDSSLENLNPAAYDLLVGSYHRPLLLSPAPSSRPPRLLARPASPSHWGAMLAVLTLWEQLPPRSRRRRTRYHRAPHSPPRRSSGKRYTTKSPEMLPVRYSSDTAAAPAITPPETPPCPSYTSHSHKLPRRRPRRPETLRAASLRAGEIGTPSTMTRMRSRIR